LAYLRKTGTSDAQDNTTAVATNPTTTSVKGIAGTTVALDSSQSFDYSVNSSDVSVLIIELRGYWETVA
jgi:hypothetical protein